VISDALNSMLVRASVALKREEGQTFVEYTLIGVLVAAALVTAMTAFKNDIGAALTTIQNAF
jgi:Flp pilus assembly pilin Flp